MTLRLGRAPTSLPGRMVAVLAASLALAVVVAGPASTAAAVVAPTPLSTPGFAQRIYAGTDWTNQADVQARSNLVAKSYNRTQSAAQAAMASGALPRSTVIEGVIVPSSQGPQTTVATRTATGAASTSFSGVAAKLGTAGAAVSGLQIGWAIGSSVAGLFGLDSEGALCQATGGNVCPGMPRPADYVPNLDAAPAGELGWKDGDNTSLGQAIPYGGGQSTSPSLTWAHSISETSFVESGYRMWDVTGLPVNPPNDGRRAYQAGSVQARCQTPGGAPAPGLTGGYGLWVNDENRSSITTQTGCDLANTLLSIAWFDQGVGDYSGTPAALWYPPGSPDRGSGAPGDPDRRWVTELTCSGGGSASSLSAVFREGDPSWPAFPSAECTGGQPVAGRVLERTVDGSAADVVMSEWEASADLVEHRGSYPQCADGSCQLVLERRVAGTTWASCFDGPAACAAWMTSPTRETDYRCRYAGSLVDLGRCLVYGPTFDPAKGTQGINYSDPETGVEGGPGAEPQPEVDPPSGADLADLGSQLGSKAPFAQLASIGTALGQMQPVAGGCLVVPVDLPETLGGDTLTAFDSCGSDLAVVWMRDHRLLLGALLWVGFITPICWWAWRTYAPGSTGAA